MRARPAVLCSSASSVPAPVVLTAGSARYTMCNPLAIGEESMKDEGRLCISKCTISRSIVPNCTMCILRVAVRYIAVRDACLMLMHV